MAWCFEDECDEYADAVLDGLMGGSAIAPSIWPLEVANVLLVAERRGRLQPSDTPRFVELLGSLPIEVDEVSLGRATGAILALGREHALSSYDAAYLDLAIREAVPLASRDQTLVEAARSCGVTLA